MRYLNGWCAERGAGNLSRVFRRKRFSGDAFASIFAAYSLEVLRAEPEILWNQGAVREVGALVAAGDAEFAERRARAHFGTAPDADPATTEQIIEKLLSGNWRDVLADMFSALHGAYIQTALNKFARENRLGNDLSAAFNTHRELHWIEGRCFAVSLGKYMPNDVLELCLDRARERARSDPSLEGFIEGAEHG